MSERKSGDRANYLKNREKIADARRRNPRKAIISSSRNRARKCGYAFDLTVEDIVIPDRCPILGIPLRLKAWAGETGGTDNSPSLDRIDPSKGYVRGNIRVVSNRANTLRNNATLKELALVYRDARVLAGFEDDE